MRKFCLICVADLLISLAVSAAPAYRGHIIVRQPDGSEIRASLRGDEYFHTLTAEDGSLLKCGEDGFYYYSSMDADGKIRRSEYRYGSAAPRDVISSSRRAQNRRPDAVRRELRNSFNISSLTKAGAASVLKGIVILVGFQDLDMAYQANLFDKMLNQEGFSEGGATGSARDYFICQSGGLMDFSFDVIYAGVAPHSKSYYGRNDDSGNDVHPAELVVDACRLVDSKIDFSRYDNDGDGEVENVYIFYAGPDEASGGDEDCIWSHNSTLNFFGLKLSLDGVTINQYAMSSELHRYSDGSEGFPTIGIFCHEFSHSLGLCDLYDTDYEKSGGESEGMWYLTSVMDMGCYSNEGRTPPSYNALELDMLGFGSGETLDSGVHTLQPICSSHKYFIVDTDMEGVRYYLECRSTESWDKYVGGNGLLVYRVDKSDNAAGYSSLAGTEVNAITRWRMNEVNCNPEHMCSKILPATDPGPVGPDIDPSQVASIFYPGITGKYSSVTFDESLLVISDIRRSGPDVKLFVKGAVSIDNVDVFQDAAIITWHLDTKETEEIMMDLLWNSDGKWRSAQVSPYSGNKYSYTVEGLKSDTEYPFRIECKDESGTPIVLKDSFVTLSSYGEQPYIYLASADRYISGAFRSGSQIPLRIFDGAGIVKVDWYLDDNPITVGDNGYYAIDKGGVLKAVLHFGDGSIEIIHKKIIIK